MRTLTALADPPITDLARLKRLADEQAALRRVATLVAVGAPSSDVFAAVAQEVAQVIGVPMVGVYRCDSDGSAITVIATCCDRPHVLRPGTRWPLDGPSMIARVLETRRPARVEDYADLPGALAAGARASGLERCAGAPILVEGRVWGVMGIASPDAPLPDGVEERLAAFTDLLASVIANTQSREELTRLVQEQMALRRMATLVAGGATPTRVFEAVIAEVGRLVPTDAAALSRYESDGMLTTVGGWSRSDGYQPIGRRHRYGRGTLAHVIGETRRPERIESYAEASGPVGDFARELGWRSSVGAPIMVEGRLWGIVGVASKTEVPLPRGTEQRLAEFTELVATAIANAESREELTRLANEQAALRRVATLVARAVPPAEIFEAVAAEVGQLLGADLALLHRYDADGTTTALAAYGAGDPPVPLGTRWMPDIASASVSVLRAGRSTTLDCYEGAAGAWPRFAAAQGYRFAVAAPIGVEGRVWGVTLAAWKRKDAFWAVDAERRIAAFADLVATGIANADGRAELDVSRARILATADATRRRIERDLHDGAQQQLVALALELRGAQAAVPPELAEHRDQLTRVVRGLTGVLDRLREIALGIHPPGLAEGGLGPALKTLTRGSPIPVTLDVRSEGRLPEPVEVAAYYVVSEALTNAVKYAHASVVHVSLEASDRLVRVAVGDDGVGGADPRRGSGLLGLKDRAEAIGGTLCLRSSRGAGTSLTVELPFDG
jgi:signal transduction histidine kinase